MAIKLRIDDLRSLTAVEFVRWACGKCFDEPSPGVTVEVIKCGPFMRMLPLQQSDLYTLIDTFGQGKYLAYVDHVTGGHSRVITITIHAPEGEIAAYPSYATYTYTINATVTEEL